ncbi:hypothetical protein VQ643_04275 [Pseudomonas sp. F1_0610]|uniref:hypothetical protein n=1 Tax=Pseudomonas sp. F1_0610 TaxID=3114284 RepID=UPI0039C18741
MYELKITQSPDPRMWYAHLIGKCVPLLREETDCYISRQPQGYINIVKKADAKRVRRKHEPNY